MSKQILISKLAADIDEFKNLVDEEPPQTLRSPVSGEPYLAHESPSSYDRIGEVEVLTPPYDDFSTDSSRIATLLSNIYHNAHNLYESFESYDPDKILTENIEYRLSLVLRDAYTTKGLLSQLFAKYSPGMK